MQSPLRLVALGLMTILVASATACSPQSTEEVSPEPEALELEASDITVWLDEKTAEGAASIAEQFEVDTGVSVSFRITEDILIELQGASPAEAIDVLIAPHALQPELISAGYIQEIAGTSELERFIPGTVAAFTNNGAQYGVPLSHENIALACVAGDMRAAPSSFSELVDAGLIVAMNDGGGDPYHLFPIQSSFGAMVFQQDQLDSSQWELALSSEENLAFASWLGDNAEIFDVTSTSDTAKSQLSSGDKACWLTGPWNRSWFDSAFGEDGWNVFPIPSAGPHPAKSFLEVRGAMVSSRSQNAKAANDFVTEYLGGEAGQVAIFNATGFPPSNLAALENISEYKFPYQFGIAGISGVPTPSHSEMDAVWYPWSQAQVAIITGVDDPAETWLEMVGQVQAAVN